MAEITPILQHFQDVLTGKATFDQIPKSQEDDQYYEDQPECKNIQKRDPSIFEIIKSQYKRRQRPPSKLTSTTTSRSQLIAPSQIMEVDSSEDSEA
ncbi:hypothetical protein O181_071833 [Austropuccinia psidii MF-1]|uniref:Uncharacterized protein n=1 Tax=Austropuccinia psidii MF-1 TaxID=1389203 RepID=A0A9Q3I8J6_9BASI|nr:hypothetical protein [Austropuccinia psidii MF-1]